jgi:hypothetical protein
VLQNKFQVGEASRLDPVRGKMPLPHPHPDRNRNPNLTIALTAAGKQHQADAITVFQPHLPPCRRISSE